MKSVVVILCLMILCCVHAEAWAETRSPRVRLETNHGVIVLELDAQAAPKTVENFLNYAREGFYDETIFHRVIDKFMIQGGGLTVGMKKKDSKPAVENEADNTLKNLRGTIAMARTNDPHSATSQFFVNTVDNAYLDHQAKTDRGWGYCVFGKVVEGMEVVESIEKVSTTTKSGRRDVPVEPVIIQRAVVE